MGNTEPNPPVGAVVVRDGEVLGEGYHHRRGAAHAEVEALRDIADPRGATVYVTLEPCDHYGLTPPCSEALLEAGVARVVIGAHDPNPKTDGAGVRRLRENGIAVEISDDPWPQRIIERFRAMQTRTRPYLTLKIASSLDGNIAPSPGAYWLTGEAARDFVRDLRASHDAVMVGAGTVRTDDPQLTVRPPRERVRPYRRVVACETHPVDPASRIFAEPSDGATYAKTIVLAPGGAASSFELLRAVADVMPIGEGEQLDLLAALEALGSAGVTSVLCEGGPTLASRLLAAGVVDRLLWILAPRLLAGERAVRSLSGVAELAATRWTFEPPQMLGDDILIEARRREDACSPA